MSPRWSPRPVGLLAVAVLVGACSGGDESQPQPLVDDIAPAIAAVERELEGPPELFEVSADLEGVSVVVAVDGATAAERWRYADGDLVGPEAIGAASGETFLGGEAVFDPDRIFDRLRDELDEPVIVDFAIQGGADGTVLLDATVASDSGGVLRVLLAPDGRILGVQGA